MQDITLTVTAREQEAIAVVCDMALKYAGNNAMQVVMAVHQAMGRAQPVTTDNTDPHRRGGA